MGDGLSGARATSWANPARRCRAGSLRAQSPFLRERDQMRVCSSLFSSPNRLA